MNEINIHRIQSDEYGTFGVWTDANGKKLCVTTERPPTGDHPCIPKNQYRWKKFFSPHNGECLLLMDVPGRTFIEVHSANVWQQLLGCIAVGAAFDYFTGKTKDGTTYTNQKGVTHSKDTLKYLLSILPETGSMVIT